MQLPKRQWQLLAREIDHCIVLADHPQRQILCAHYTHCQTGRKAGNRIRPSPAAVADDGKWIRAIEWAITVFGFRNVPIFMVEILAAGEDGFELAPLRYFQKPADSETFAKVRKLLFIGRCGPLLFPLLVFWIQVCLQKHDNSCNPRCNPRSNRKNLQNTQNSRCCRTGGANNFVGFFLTKRCCFSLCCPGFLRLFLRVQSLEIFANIFHIFEMAFLGLQRKTHIFLQVTHIRAKISS